MRAKVLESTKACQLSKMILCIQGRDIAVLSLPENKETRLRKN
jgi:hypothetical protein